MCDLIDLNSPDSRKLAASKLASPLIPGPSTPAKKNCEKINSVDFLCQGKRSSLDNNPFDKVLKETVEYAAKKDDPFESVLEKALQSKDRGIKTVHSSCSDEHREDFTPKRRRHSDVLKMNKTLEEPLLQGIMNKNLTHLLKMSGYTDVNQSVVKDLNTAEFLDNNEGKNSAEFKRKAMNGLSSPNVVIYPPSPTNCSFLSQSAMNDSLSELRDITAADTKNTANTSAEEVFVSGTASELLKPSKHRRSLSQGNKKSPESPAKETAFRPRSKSIIDTLKVIEISNKSRLSSTSNASSSINDFGNNAFMETRSTINSESLDISRISATPKLSQSSCGSFGSLYSCSSKNRAFILDSQSSSRIFGNTSSAKSSMNLSNISKATSAGLNFIKTPLKTPVRIADLELRFERLKMQSAASVGDLPFYSPNRKVQNFLKAESADKRTDHILERDVKLIDANVFVPALEERDRNIEKMESGSNCSSDSVFIENEKVDQSVFREAKLLARTFDELALQSTSNSFSSGDDLLYSRPRWNFDILPVSDDEEPVVDNLIELPVSPAKNEADLPLNPTEVDDVQQSAAKKASDEIKELETQFIDQEVARNKATAATLLLDLEKIVHRENNQEAITLLENLEKVLGVKYESNAQLLATCLQTTNNLNKSPKKCTAKLGSHENIKHESLENSHEDNNDAGLSNSMKIVNIRNDESLSMNLNIEKTINKSKKSIVADLTQDDEEIKGNVSEKVNNSSNTSVNEQKEILVDQTEALELITNLSKILGGRNNDSSPLSLLTNLRQVLNLATNQLNFENSQITKSQNQELLCEVQSEKNASLKRLPMKPKLDAIKVTRKKSIDSSAKRQSTVPNSIKRSMSLGSTQRNIMSVAAIGKEKAKPDLKSIKKALSCDAVPKPGTVEKTSSVAPEVGRIRASTIGGTGKYKLKKKSEVETVAGKKGPLKALLPVGNMQRRGSLSSKVAPISVSQTPPKSKSTAPSTFTSATSSTPNPTVTIVSKKSPKTKPVASSTPDGGGSKTRKIRLQFSRNMAKPKFSCNISPVTPLPTHSITSSVAFKGSPKKYRHNKTLSPPKRRGSYEAQVLNTTESNIPKYSPRAGFSRRNSKEAIKTLDNSGSPKTSSTKSQTPKKSPFVQSKSGSQIPQSPLKTMNSQNSKFKPFNLISKLRRGSNVSDKENCA